jgi:hypothetical protein
VTATPLDAAVRRIGGALAVTDRQIAAVRESMTPGQRQTAALALAVIAAVLLAGSPRTARTARPSTTIPATSVPSGASRSP